MFKYDITMFNFLNSETLHRNAFLEATIAEAHGNLTGNDEVKKALGDDADYLAMIIEDMYVPNIRDGEVVIPKSRLHSHRTPILTIRPDEEFILGSTCAVQNEFQKECLLEEAEVWAGNSDKYGDELQEEVDAALADSFRHKVTGTMKFHGRVTSVEAMLGLPESQFPNMGPNQFKDFIGRPIVFMTIARTMRWQPHVVLAHEAEHVDQRNQQPWFSAFPPDIVDDSLRRELEAYHVGSVYETALCNSDDWRYAGRTDLLGQIAIEQLRQKHQTEPDDPFYPSKEIKLALQRIGNEGVY
jgi:hypothetical protein